jgi:formylglycine-generating enzyme required for sulfatase activity
VSQLFDALQREEKPQARALTNAVGIKAILIPAGTYRMGSPPDQAGARLNEAPPHEVILQQPFYLATTPVTQSQYRQVMGQNPARFQPAAGGGPDHPVESVSWHDAVAFCRALSERDDERDAKRTYRLPTEAEWEYAARAGSDTVFTYGDQLLPAQANVAHAEGIERTSKVGSFPANNFGLFDVHGNVWEWCQDWYGEAYYAKSPSRDPQGPAEGKFRVVRGGSWRSSPATCRSAYRNALMPHNRDPYTGFRVVCVLTHENELQGL